MKHLEGGDEGGGVEEDLGSRSGGSSLFDGNQEPIIFGRQGQSVHTSYTR